MKCRLLYIGYSVINCVSPTPLINRVSNVALLDALGDYCKRLVLLQQDDKKHDNSLNIRKFILGLIETIEWTISMKAFRQYVQCI